MKKSNKDKINKKEGKNLESSKNITPVTFDTNDTNDTNDTSDTNKTCIKCINVSLPPEVLFGHDLVELALAHFYTTKNTPITLDKLSKNIGQKYGSLRLALHRKKELFNDTGKKGNAKMIHVSDLGIDEINRRIEVQNTKRAKKEEASSQELIIKKNEENMKKEIYTLAKTFFEAHKKKLFKDMNGCVFNIQFKDICEFDLDLSERILNEPEDTLEKIEAAIVDYGLVETCRVRIYDLPKDKKVNIENLRSKDVGEFVSLIGRVVSISDVRPQCVRAKFECPSCGTIISVMQLDNKFREPNRCSCGRRGGFKLIDKDMVDTARIILEDLQEKTDNPHTKRINTFIKEDLTSDENIKLFYPGNEIEIVGVLKEIPITLKTGGLSTRFEIALDVNSVMTTEENIEVNNLSEEDIKEIIELSKKIDVDGLDVINKSFAPDIYGHECIKNAIILQLCGGKNEVGAAGKNTPNILLIGDPGSAKTVIGDFAVKITPGSRKAVGGSSSGVGITASVVRDDYGGGWRVEPGALVLARSFFFLDEMNNLQDEDKPKLQEALSENTVTVNKATIRMTLKASAGVLGTANPVHGLFKDNEDLVKQFNLPSPIINRFDQIFTIRDDVNDFIDEKIAEKIIDRERNKIEAEYSEELLKKFFIYIKDQPNPKISDAIAKKLKKLYSKLRRYKTSSLNINPRVQVAFIQLCKSSAKIRTSKFVEEKDIEIALNILSKSYFKTPEYKFLKEDGGEK